jgi:hypothetical protein
MHYKFLIRMGALITRLVQTGDQISKRVIDHSSGDLITSLDPFGALITRLEIQSPDYATKYAKIRNK